MKKHLLTMAAMTLLAACSKSDVQEETINSPIKFSAVVGNNSKATTGLIDLTALKASTDGFAVSTSGLGSGSEMNNVVVKYSGSAWGYTGDYFWPINSSQTVNFTAYAPAGTTNVALTSAGLTATNFVPSATVGSQIDLIYAPPSAFTRAGSGVSGVALNFNHLLTQVVFSVSTDIPVSDAPQITSIVLSVPNNKGNFDGTNWTVSAQSQSYTLFNNTALSSTPVTSIPLLLLPQTLPTGTNATVTFSVNGSTSSNTVDLSSLTTVTSWAKGTKVTYNISFNNTDLKIKFTDPTISNWTNSSDGIIY